MRSPHPFRAALAFVLLFHLPAAALKVRGYSQALHNRLLSFPGQPIYAQTPAVNSTFFQAPGNQYLGIGWPAHPTDWTRQMGLVSPRHFVYATHYPLGADWQIAFLGSDGQQRLYGIESHAPLINNQGQATDLTIYTLNSEIPATAGITPFAVLNLPAEADYLNKDMTVFGGFVRAGKTPLTVFMNLVNDPGFETTRFACFTYNRSRGNANECEYEGGDSGAPAFIMDGGKPALIGTCAGIDQPGEAGLPSYLSRNYISFLPAYLPQADALMESKGYHVIRSRPAATTVTVQATTPSPLRRMKSGAVSLILSNSGANTAHNISVNLGFSQAPSSVSGAGTTCEATSATQWKCRRGGLVGAAQTGITSTWNTLPNAQNLQVSWIRSYDGATTETLNFTLPLLESFSSWIQGAAASSELGDPDHDGLPNLVEYALGGSPVGSSLAPIGGHPQVPQVDVSNGRLRVRYPRRTDAVSRGLTSLVQFSGNPASGAWTDELPAGTIMEATPYSPSSPGFEQVTVFVPMSSGRLFARVKVILNE